MKLIDRDALLEDIGEEPMNWTNSPEEIQEYIDWKQTVAIINSAPTIEAEPVRQGHWVNRGKDLEAHSMKVFDAWSCSRCRYYIHGNGYPKWKYCPMCGCRMKGENE